MYNKKNGYSKRIKKYSFLPSLNDNEFPANIIGGRKFTNFKNFVELRVYNLRLTFAIKFIRTQLKNKNEKKNVLPSETHMKRFGTMTFSHERKKKHVWKCW